ncbi:hypothetical protein MBANPS3_006232 [Mucor bainieri]
MDVEGTILPITYRPIVLFSIDPVSLLQLHQTDKHIPLYKPIFILSGILSFIVMINLIIYWLYDNALPLIPYISALVLLLWPGKSLQRRERVRFTRMLKRVFSINIFAPVFFSDIILADMLTSFSNVFGDLFIASCRLHDSSLNKASYKVYVPLNAEYIESKEKRHIFNALKYTSSIPVVVFSAVQRKAAIYIAESGTVPQHWYLKEDTIFRMLFVFINSMYSFWWDISMDWNLLSITFDTPQTDENVHHKTVQLPPQKHTTPIVHFRRQLYFSQPIWYIIAIFFDFLLRITWSLKLSSHIYIRKLDGSIFLMELLEVFRRWIWVIFRMESEWVKKVYSSLPSGSFDSLRMSLLDRKPSSSSGLLSPIEEEDP